ncbi:SMC5-SMC6 complex localization factor protein 1 isoform X4 [Nerophis ophidion]|nr:SMC5-SMC6 complex localization factor protein 1 isoform X4 [Nerophis ophidion]
MASCSHVFQISGIKIRDEKRFLIQGIHQLDGKYIGGSVFQSACTHLIVPQVLSSEKFLASCAAGKWVVTVNYVLDSVKNGSWLPEEPYELSVSTGTKSVFYPVRQWREKVISGKISGAFQGWRVLLMVRNTNRSPVFKRLLKAGCASVYSYPPPADVSITHVMAKPITIDARSHNAPCIPVSHIVKHLFGNNSVNMNFNITNDYETNETSVVDVDFSELETELKEYAIKQERRPRMFFLEFLDDHALYHPQSQASETDLSNVGSMIECGLSIEALDTIRSAVFPGFLPPAPYMVSLMEYAQQGSATPVFMRSFQQILHRLLVNNPPWLGPTTVKKYFSQLLQCPRCKTGQWPFLETAISYCLSSEATCHRLPGPALPTLLQFHRDLLEFFLKLFQGELHSVTTCDFQQLSSAATSRVSTSGTLLYGTFWTVWERSTLLSCAVKRLIQLMMQAASALIVRCGSFSPKDHAGKNENNHKRHLVDLLLGLLSVLVEFWCQQHIKQNQKLVEKGLKCLSEHFAVTSQSLSLVFLAELVAKVTSTRLRLALVDAIFRNICCKNEITVGDEPLSLKKVMLSYLPALGHLAQSHRWMQHTSNSCTDPDTNCGTLSPVEDKSRKEYILRALNKVNAAGETLLHIACKKNQVETVLQILALPGIDVNVKDYTGWTPLHEACNHGSTACVEALLRHRPAPFLKYAVGGVTPLHDAVVNGHMDIAKMLLETAGSELLQLTDGKGCTALDLVSATSQKAELVRSAEAGDSNLKKATEGINYTLLEAGSCMLAHLIVCHLQETGLPGRMEPSHMVSGLGNKLVQALERHSLQKVTLGWTDLRAVRLARDTDTLLEFARQKLSGQVCSVVKEHEGENTLLLMEILENLESQGQILLAEVDKDFRN